MKKRIIVGMLVVGLGALSASAVPIDSVVLGQPDQDHTITLESANVLETVNGTDYYVWTYTVTSDRQPAISHWSLTVCAALFANVSRGEDFETSRVGGDTGLLVLKFEDGYDDNETRTVKIYLTAAASLEEGPVLIKAGRNVYEGTIISPHCGEVPEPTTIALLGACSVLMAARKRRS